MSLKTLFELCRCIVFFSGNAWERRYHTFSSQTPFIIRPPSRLRKNVRPAYQQFRLKFS